MAYDEAEQRQLQESLLPNHQKDEYNDNDIPKTTNIGWLKNYFRGHFLPSIKRKIFIIIFFSICLSILLSSQHNSNEEDNENTNKSNVSLIEEENYKYFPSNSKYEKFMTYLPHGNIFQQREELENAIFLAYSLNRTLIIPPIILGLNIDFTTSQILQKKLISLRTNKHQTDCFIKTTNPEQKEIKYEIDINCLNEFDSYSLLRWDSLFSLDLIKKKIPILHRNDFDQIKLEEMLNITDSNQDIYEIMKSSLEKNKFTLNSIRSLDEKLLSFNYLSGKDLIIKDLSKDQLSFWNQIDSSLILNNPIILNVSKNIIKKLGGIGNYVSVHARLLSTSKKFLKNSFSNLSKSLKDFFSKNLINNFCEDSNSNIIYLATDLNRNDTILLSFLSQFPCVKMMTDFNEILFPLLELYNPKDGTFLYKFFEPLVNSIVASSGMKLFTIDDGIYSEFAKKLHHEQQR
ncbi:hypothetical protein C1645_792208 [Glomus cerebriforme]|uniref:Ciga protein n=1 Tax=Glomus cerebriforme TaxID=658196 RepID=A0A397S2I5_9GLOM|nr:hypothetical protein C1645_792208 [Glomus cerebriforme]